MALLAEEKRQIKRLRPLLPECTVLLRSNGDFPLDAPCELALYGSGARRTVKGGTGSGEVNSRFSINAETGLRAAGFTITTKDWLDSYDEIRKAAKKEFGQQLRRKAKAAHQNVIAAGMGAVCPEPEYELPLDGAGDIAIYVLARSSGEGNDRALVGGDLLLTDTERRDIEALAEKYQKFLLVLNVCGPVDLSGLDCVKNILLLSQLGALTGTALADLLLGSTYPSGKLSTTWAMPQKAWPGSFGGADETCYREGIYVGYRFFDSLGLTPQFPFGFGLGYTGFAVRGTQIAADKTRLSVSVSVKNVGRRPGREVVQLYASMPQGKLDQPYQMLAAFEKTKELAAGEEMELTLSFDLAELASYDEEQAAYLLEAGDYILRLGVSSANTAPCCLVRLDETALVRRVKHIGGKPDFNDLKAPVTAREELTELPVLNVSASLFETEEISYQYAPAADELVQELTDGELALMNVGAFSDKKGVAGIIGEASSSVAGAAGETTGALKAKGISPLIMADGPAGLRLSRDFVRDEKGSHGLELPLPATMLDYLPGAAKKAAGLLRRKPKKGETVEHQYATAIPIGTALAQSWNPALAEVCGDLVGEEMERFGVNLWLAPGMNIHRDVRCGRNFEYYSEDPLLTGRIAAGITRGVQKHPGCGVTVKHFAVNNQETNRYGSNSVVSERALREIYLKGFAVCIREASPAALMTSYNLLNGTHTAARRDLIIDFLRCECGYEGIVMTDWLSAQNLLTKNAKYAPAKAFEMAAAGNQLIMPGFRSDVKDLQESLANGEISRGELEQNAAGLLGNIRRLGR